MEDPKLTPQIGSLNLADSFPSEAEIHALVARALNQHCDQTREQVARELSRITGRTVTKRMLDDWAAESKAHVSFPARFVKPLCIVSGDDGLQRALLSAEILADLNRGEWARQHGWIFSEMRKEVNALLKAQRRKPQSAKKLKPKRRR